jgi:hypothetical protein
MRATTHYGLTILRIAVDVRQFLPRVRAGVSRCGFPLTVSCRKGTVFDSWLALILRTPCDSVGGVGGWSGGVEPT